MLEVRRETVALRRTMEIVETMEKRGLLLSEINFVMVFGGNINGKIEALCK